MPGWAIIIGSCVIVACVGAIVSLLVAWVNQNEKNYLSIDLIQAINDWQIGEHKVRDGRRLKALAKNLPRQFTSCNHDCFRQIAIKKDSLWTLADQLELPETISSWTTQINMAKKFKGGVPPKFQYQGIIFRLSPSMGSVILNIEEMYKDNNFINFIESNKNNIDRYDDGIGSYFDTEHEVVIEINKIKLNDIHSLGGFSSSKEKLAELFLGRRPNHHELQNFDALLNKKGIQLGPKWIEGDAKDRLLSKIRQIVPNNKRFKYIQEEDYIEQNKTKNNSF